MKTLLTLILISAGFNMLAQTADTAQINATKDTLMPASTERTYKVDMRKYSRDSASSSAPNFLEPYRNKPLESNYQYDNGKVTGGSTKLKIGKKKDH